MDTYDPVDAASEYLRMAERYRQMSDEELLVLVPQSSELTPVAQQALAGEVRQRRIKIEPDSDSNSNGGESRQPNPPFEPPAFVLREPPQPYDSSRHDVPDDESVGDGSYDADSQGEETSYDEDRRLVSIRLVWSVRDALELQTILENAGIPFFIGPEKATGVDKVTSDFSKGLDVKVMQVGMTWAARAMNGTYFAKDDPKEDHQEPEDIAVHCSKCHSTEVVFEGLVGEPPKSNDAAPQRFSWACDSCGNRWEDDGAMEE